MPLSLGKGSTSIRLLSLFFSFCFFVIPFSFLLFKIIFIHHCIIHIIIILLIFIITVIIFSFVLALVEPDSDAGVFGQRFIGCIWNLWKLIILGTLDNPRANPRATIPWTSPRSSPGHLQGRPQRSPRSSPEIDLCFPHSLHIILGNIGLSQNLLKTRAFHIPDFLFVLKIGKKRIALELLSCLFL